MYTKAFSDMGNMMELVVINAMVLSLTKSTLWLTAVLAARVFGGICSSLFSGILADRYNRRMLMIMSDLFRGIFVLWLFLFPTPVLFLSISFILGFFSSFFSVSFSAEIPQIYGDKKILDINALISRLSSISMVVGFMLAAWLSTVLNYRVIILIDSISFFLSAAVLWNFKWNKDEQRTKGQSLKNWSQDIKQVKNHLFINPVLLILFTIYIFQTFAASSQNVGIPLLAKMLNPHEITFYQGLIWGSWGMGGILATWVIPKIKWFKRNLLYVYLGSSLMASLGFIFLLSNKVFWIILFFAFITGMFDASLSSFFSTIVQMTDNSIRGRIFGVSNLLSQLGFTIGFIVTSCLINILTMPHLVWLFHGSTIAIIVAMALIIKSRYSLKEISNTVNQ
nr:MFS transporter [Bacillus sp. FJAT-49736]